MALTWRFQNDNGRKNGDQQQKLRREQREEFFEIESLNIEFQAEHQS